MEITSKTEQTLDALHSQINNSSILSIVSPLFETIKHQDEYHPGRMSNENGHMQLLWRRGERQHINYEQLCLTLSDKVLSLTIALDHRHDRASNNIPSLPYPAQILQSRSTLVLSPHTQKLYETHRVNGVMLGEHHGEEATDRFTPELTHTLAVIGLYGYRQTEQRQVV